MVQIAAPGFGRGLVHGRGIIRNANIQKYQKDLNKIRENAATQKAREDEQDNKVLKLNKALEFLKSDALDSQGKANFQDAVVAPAFKDALGVDIPKGIDFKQVNAKKLAGFLREIADLKTQKLDPDVAKAQSLSLDARFSQEFPSVYDDVKQSQAKQKEESGKKARGETVDIMNQLSGAGIDPDTARGLKDKLKSLRGSFPEKVQQGIKDYSDTKKAIPKTLPSFRQTVQDTGSYIKKLSESGKLSDLEVDQEINAIMQLYNVPDDRRPEVEKMISDIVKPPAQQVSGQGSAQNPPEKESMGEFISREWLNLLVNPSAAIRTK